MFTNEFLWDASVTTVLDDAGLHEDVEIIISDECICLRQWRDDEWAELIIVSHAQWAEMLTAQDLPEGVYHTRITRS
jgi:hypothetical protein